MPNYGLVINSRFRPFSYQEMLAPTLQATQAHQAVEDTYGQLQTKADEWKIIAMEEPDSKAAQMYNNYANSLEAAAEDLAKNGLNLTSRQSLWNMTKRYSSEINPIAEAFKRKQLLSEEQRKSGNSMIYDMDAATTSIDRFLENPTLQYQSIDRKDLLNRSMAEFGSLAKSLEAYGKGQPVDNYTNTFIQQHGITRKAASDFIEAVRSGNISSTDPTLKAIYNNLYNSTRVSEWDSPTAKEAVKNTILEGVVAGIGQSNIGTVENYGSRQALQHYYQKQLVDYKAEQDRLRDEQARIKAWDPNETHITLNNSVGKERTKKGEQARLDYLKKHQLDIEQANANKEYNQRRAILRDMIVYPTDNEPVSLKEASGRFKLGVANKRVSGEGLNLQRYINMGWVDRNGNLTQKGFNAVYSSERNVIDYKSLAEEAQREAEENFDKTLSGSGQRGSVKVMRLSVEGAGLENKILTAIGEEGKLYRVDDYDGRTNKVTSKSSIKYKDLRDAFSATGSDKLTITYLGNMPETDQQMIQTSDGKWYLLPAGVYSDTQQRNISNTNQFLQNEGLNEYQQAVYGNNLMVYLGAPLNINKGETIKTNDGSIIIN